jgi:prevent-host-death family protein
VGLFKQALKGCAIMNVTATQLKNKLGTYLDMSITEPVIVQKAGRTVAAMISYSYYEKLLEMEDAFWANKALESEKSGYIGSASLDKLMSLGDNRSSE